MIILDNIDLNVVSEKEIKNIVHLCAKYSCVTIRNQSLSVEREVEIVKMFPNPYVLFKPGTTGFDRSALDKEGYIGLVTKDSIAGHEEEMLWHNESPHVRSGSSVAWLYAERGVEGSITIWNDTIKAYKDLDNETKELIKDLKVITFGNVNHSVKRTEENFNSRTVYINNLSPLVHTNHLGETGLFLSLYQFERFEGMTREESLKIAEPLFEFVTQEKYCYSHEWQDGDVSLSDQWLGVHRRLHFNYMKTRRMHRATFDYPENYL